MKTVIHVNRHRIAANRKGGEAMPVFTVRDYKKARRGNSVICHGPVQFCYTPDRPLSCGATAYVVTYGKVEVAA